MIKEYAAQLARATAAVQQISDGVPTYVTLFIAALTFIMLWIIVVQIIVLVDRLALVQARHKSLQRKGAARCTSS